MNGARNPEISVKVDVVVAMVIVVTVETEVIEVKEVIDLNVVVEEVVTVMIEEKDGEILTRLVSTVTGEVISLVTVRAEEDQDQEIEMEEIGAVMTIEDLEEVDHHVMTVGGEDQEVLTYQDQMIEIEETIEIEVIESLMIEEKNHTEIETIIEVVEIEIEKIEEMTEEETEIQKRDLNLLEVPEMEEKKREKVVIDQDLDLVHQEVVETLEVVNLKRIDQKDLLNQLTKDQIFLEIKIKMRSNLKMDMVMFKKKNLINNPCQETGMKIITEMMITSRIAQKRLLMLIPNMLVKIIKIMIELGNI